MDIIIALVLVAGITLGVKAANKFLPFSVCAICAGVSGAWVLLSFAILTDLAQAAVYLSVITLLMGGTVVGIAYQAEKKFVPISSSFLNIDNPLFTNSDGEILISLPFGKYKADILNLGYLGKTVEFEISENENSGYPVVILDSVPITIVSLIRYYWGSFNEVFLNNTYNYFASLQNSIRFF